MESGMRRLDGSCICTRTIASRRELCNGMNEMFMSAHMNIRVCVFSTTLIQQLNDNRKCTANDPLLSVSGQNMSVRASHLLQRQDYAVVRDSLHTYFWLRL